VWLLKREVHGRSQAARQGSSGQRLARRVPAGHIFPIPERLQPTGVTHLMYRSDLLRDVELLIRSRHGLLVFDTVEEERAETLLRHLADGMGVPLFSWSLNRGLRRAERDNAIYDTAEPAKALDHVESSAIAGIYLFRGLGPFLDNPRIAARLSELASTFRGREGVIVLIGENELPESLRAVATVLRLPQPQPEEYRSLLQHILRDLSARVPVKVELTSEDRNSLLRALAGLTLLEAEKVLTKAIVEDGKLDAHDIREVIRTKSRIVEREGLLEYYPVEESTVEIAGLAGLKRWLAKRRGILAEPERAREYGLDFPKGVLLVGVPGCGKSLCAKAVAVEWKLPLLKLDPSALYNRYVGESERNFRRAIQTAERLSPVILWIDELEKAFSTGQGTEDGGLSTRILGTFLSWMQDRRGDVFVVATANDVGRVPPELLRKGRFDEIFFVDLPDAADRRAILEIHLRRRRQDPATFDLDGLAAATDGFSGSELEAVVVSGLYTAFAGRGPLSDEILREEARGTVPLSVSMAEKIARLRAWKEGRALDAA
jgi:SpoVK/Ycf46/Vps4 family AAA+-type ATPase